MIVISNQLVINEQELELNAIRAQGAGGQNVKTFRLIKPTTINSDNTSA